MLKFIDASCRLGRPAAPGDMPWKKEQIVELMDRCRIEKALAYHIVAKDGEITDGNQLLMEEIKGDARFEPQWCAIPATFDEFFRAEKLHGMMKENNVRTLRIAPKNYAHDYRPHAMGELMGLAADCKIPVFLDYGEAAGDDLYDLCSAYPNVKFVITNTSYGLNRFLGPILDNCANLYLATGNYVVHTGLELMCKYYGAEKMVFNTNLPTGSAVAAVSLVCFANISDEEKQMIAYGNLEKMLSEVKL